MYNGKFYQILKPMISFKEYQCSHREGKGIKRKIGVMKKLNFSNGQSLLILDKGTLIGLNWYLYISYINIDNERLVEHFSPGSW